MIEGEFRPMYESHEAGNEDWLVTESLMNRGKRNEGAEKTK